MADRPGGTGATGARWTHDADLVARVRAALRDAGVEPSRLTPETLAALDQFHIGGLGATLALARCAGMRPGCAVLDLGGGLGGPARTLAREFGAIVTVVDVTPSYARLGDWLTARTGFTGRVRFVAADALALPFAAETFDMVWTQASGMNVADKAALYAEARRVLRPGGLLALQEPATGRRLPLRFPVTWADEQGHSYLCPPRVLRGLVAAAGLRERSWSDVTAEILTAMPVAAEPCPVPLDVSLLLGPNAEVKLGNLACNLAEGRLAVVQGVFERT